MYINSSEFIGIAMQTKHKKKLSYSIPITVLLLLTCYQCLTHWLNAAPPERGTRVLFFDERTHNIISFSCSRTEKKNSVNFDKQIRTNWIFFPSLCDYNGAISRIKLFSWFIYFWFYFDGFSENFFFLRSRKQPVWESPKSSI